MRRTRPSHLTRFNSVISGLTVALGLGAALVFAPISARGGNLSPDAERAPATARVMAVINEIVQSMTDTRYQHQTRVRKSRGEYYFDCSGMVQWIMKQAAPAALSVVGSPEGGRPLARNFFSTIARIKPGSTRGPWKRLARIEDAGPGDVLAWIRPKWFPSKSTGHVAIILDKPKKNTGSVPGWLFRIADASKFQHEDDTRGQNETGFGMGTLLVPVDNRGNAVGYGWFGSQTAEDWIVPTDLVIGRPLR